MSGQAKRSRVLAAQRHRRAVARELGRIEWARRGRPGCDLTDGGAHNRRCYAEVIEAGGFFDIHAAREHATALVALAEEQAKFEAWCREREQGPENRELGAFAERVEWCYTHSMWERLAAEGQGWDWMGGKVYFGESASFPMVRGLNYGGWPGNLAREWAVLDHDRRAPMGRSLARLGQRILDMEHAHRQTAQMTVEGAGEMIQATLRALGYHGREFEIIKRNEVQTVIREDGWSSHRDRDEPMELRGIDDLLTCSDCKSTGHNIRGYLPPLEWSPAVRRAHKDSTDARQGATLDSWVDSIEVEGGRPEAVAQALLNQHRTP